MQRTVITKLLLAACCSQLLLCSTTSNTRTTTVAPDGTQTITEPLPDPFTMLQSKCLERRFE